MPVVTTPVGGEGTCEDVLSSPWGGFCGSFDAGEIADEAVRLHEDESAWEAAAERGRNLFEAQFDEGRNLEALRSVVECRLSTLGADRARDYAGGAFWHQTLRSTEFFSRWIELKEDKERASGKRAPAVVANLP